MMNGFFGCGAGYGPIINLLILGIIIWLIVYAIKNTNLGHSGLNSVSADASALEILKKRYARGEISKDEFEQIKKEIL